MFPSASCKCSIQGVVRTAERPPRMVKGLGVLRSEGFSGRGTQNAKTGTVPSKLEQLVTILTAQSISCYGLAC